MTGNCPDTFAAGTKRCKALRETTSVMGDQSKNRDFTKYIKSASLPYEIKRLWLLFWLMTAELAFKSYCMAWFRSCSAAGVEIDAFWVSRYSGASKLITICSRKVSRYTLSTMMESVIMTLIKEFFDNKMNNKNVHLESSKGDENKNLLGLNYQQWSQRLLWLERWKSKPLLQNNDNNDNRQYYSLENTKK